MTEFEKESIKQQIEDTYKSIQQFEEEAKRLERKLITADMTNAEIKLYDNDFFKDDKEQTTFYNAELGRAYKEISLSKNKQDIVYYEEDCGNWVIPKEVMIAYCEYLKEKGVDK